MYKVIVQRVEFSTETLLRAIRFKRDDDNGLCVDDIIEYIDDDVGAKRLAKTWFWLPDDTDIEVWDGENHIPAETGRSRKFISRMTKAIAQVRE